MRLSERELVETTGGSTIATIAVIGTASLLSVAVFKIYQAWKGKLTLPGGFGIEWQTK